MNFSDQKVYINVKDYSVSNENFDLLLDSELELLKTHPQPHPSNLGKYYESEDYISHTDAKRTFFEKIYHIVKTYSLNKKIKLINSYNSKPGKLLDIGAGTGDFLVAAKTAGWDVLGIEPNENAKKLAISKGILIQNYIESIENQHFDVITMWHVLEHVPDIRHQIQLLSKLLKPNGTIVIAVPNFKSYDAQYYGKHWAAYDVPRHLWHFSQKSIKQIVSRENLKVSKILPMIFDSFYVSLLSEKYKNGRMNFLKAFFIGFLSNLKAFKTKEYSSLIYIIKSS